MAYPATADPTVTTETGNTTSHVVSLPSVVSGDLLVIMGGIDGDTNITNFGVFTSLHIDNALTNMTLTGGRRICDGTEGATTTITTNSSEQSAWHVYKITGWHGTSVPEVGTAAKQLTADDSPDPPSLTASWGSEQNLWFAYGTYNTGARTVTTAPSGFGNLINTSSDSGPGTGNMWSCRLEETTATKDPGVATMDDTNIWIAQTLVIRPAAGGGGTILLQMLTQ